MKTSTILRRAAAYVAKQQALGCLCCCCPAIWGQFSWDKTASRREVDGAQDLFEGLFRPEAKDGDDPWWGIFSVDDEPVLFRREQDARVIALLLAAGIAKGKGI